MKKDNNGFGRKTRKQGKKKIIKYVVIGALVVGIGVGGSYYVIHYANARTVESTTSNLTYQVDEVTKDEVTSSVSGSGTLTPIKTNTITAQVNGTVESVTKAVSDEVTPGEAIIQLSSDEVEAQIKEKQTQLEDIETKLATTTKLATSKYIKSPGAGQVKLIQVEEGSIVEDIMNDKEILCYISTDGKMLVTVSTDEEVSKYDEVTVAIGDDKEDGTVIAVSGKNITVEIDENEYEIGADAKVYNSDSKLLGEGKMELSEYLKVTAQEGVISSILKEENSTVYKNTNLFKLKAYPTSATYTSLVEQKATLEKEISNLQSQLIISVDYAGTVTDMKAVVGNTVAAGDTLATVQGDAGYELTVAVDELDISDISLGLEADITLDAVDGNYKGKVTYISQVGDTSASVTTYNVVIQVDPIEGVLSGMSATANITTESSGDSLVVPVNAVQTRQGESFIYLAPQNTKKGDELASSQVNKDELEKVTVTTGMSDGSYIVVKGDVKQGDLVLIPVLTTTEDGSSSSSTERKDMMGGMSGQMPDRGTSGQMPNMGGAPSGSGSGSGSGNRPSQGSTSGN